MTEFKEVNITEFCGFCESPLSYLVDMVQESATEYAFSEDSAERDEFEAIEQDSPNRGEFESELTNLWLDCYDIKKTMTNLAKSWARAYQNEFDFDLVEGFEPWQFGDIDFLKYYNFTTDRLFMNVPMPMLETLYKAFVIENTDCLAKVIKDRFTSRSGFSSFYSNDVETWAAKPLADYDHNELGVLLTCHALDSCGGDLQEKVNYLEIPDSGCNDIVLDWPKYESGLEALGNKYSKRKA